jgi:membrane associated rhomboid family serine protease
MNIIRRPFRYRNDGAVYWLIGVNALVFAASWLLGPGFSRFLTQRLAMVPALVLRGWVWTFVSYMFIHGGLSHFVFNMLALFVFGTPVERQMGSREFLLYYLLTGALAGLFSFAAYLLTGAYYVYLMGASGAIFAVELAYAVFFPDSVIYLWGIIPLPAPVMVLGFTGLELFFAITGSATGVAHITHLVGFVFGWLYFLVRLGMNPWRRLTGR